MANPFTKVGRLENQTRHGGSRLAGRAGAALSGLAAAEQLKQMKKQAKAEKRGRQTSATSATSAAPAAWYADPHGVARLRYWDGQTWTAHTAP